MSIITAGFEHGMRNAIERRAKKRAAEMAEGMVQEMARQRAEGIIQEKVQAVTEKAAKDRAQEREALIKFMRSKGIPDEAIDAFFRQLPQQHGTAGA